MDDSLHHYRLVITQMHCASCVNKIEQVLQPITGVRTVAVNFAEKTARIDTDQTIHPDLLIETLKRIGYEAQLVADVAEEKQFKTVIEERYYRQLIRQTVFAFIVGFPIAIVSM